MKSNKQKNIIIICVLAFIILLGYFYSKNKNISTVSMNKSIKEWDVHYQVTPSNENFLYKYEKIADFPRKNAGLTSTISFVYIPETDADKILNRGWETCELPAISQYTIDPSGLGYGPLPDHIKKIDQNYYLLGEGPQTPCSNEKGEVISGDAEKVYREHIKTVEQIFNTLQAN